ncbi:hypothetical protein GW17_00031202 [Ensete ventricosum]|nr:hypothetical protein GW17_00031202 [Ensete ventricosum]
MLRRRHIAIMLDVTSLVAARMQDNMEEPVLNSSFVKATPFAYGSGHVRPNRAMDPGLVYDLTTNDYLDFLCALGYNSTQLAMFSKAEAYSCPPTPLRIEDLNYPSITVPQLSVSATVTRVVKNVGSPGTYVARVIEPRGVAVAVNPARLAFEKVGDEHKFEVTLKGKHRTSSNGEYVFGALIWSDGKHYSTPLAVCDRESAFVLTKRCIRLGVRPNHEPSITFPTAATARIRFLDVLRCADVFSFDCLCCSSLLIQIPEVAEDVGFRAFDTSRTRDSDDFRGWRSW